MLLTNEINNIKNSAISINDAPAFSLLDETMESYFIPYSSSKHMNTTLVEYSSGILDFKKNLGSLWDTSPQKIYQKDVLSIITKIQDSEESVLEAIDLYNYMM